MTKEHDNSVVLESLTLPSVEEVQQIRKKLAFAAAMLKTAEAAVFLSVQPGTLDQWRWNGKGPKFVKIGRSVRYRISDLQAFMEARTYRSTTEAQAL